MTLNDAPPNGDKDACVARLLRLLRRGGRWWKKRCVAGRFL